MNKNTQTSQLIDLSGIINFRDFAGIKTKDGRTIKQGLIFRSADLTDMTEKDQQLFKDMGVLTGLHKKRKSVQIHNCLLSIIIESP